MSDSEYECFGIDVNACPISPCSNLPERIVGCKPGSDGIIKLLVKWKTIPNHNCYSFCNNEEANLKWPQIVIQYYETIKIVEGKLIIYLMKLIINEFYYVNFVVWTKFSSKRMTYVYLL